MAQPVPPIFIVEDRDIGIFGSVEEAQNHFEPVDAASSNEGFDSLGRKLSIEVGKKRNRISLSKETPSAADEFEKKLREFLAGYAREPRAADPACDLPCLVELAKQHFD